jgi:hypothetical protein
VTQRICGRKWSSDAVGLFFLMAAICGAVVGCGRPEMGPVSGTLRYQGNPVPDATVKFTAQSRPTAVGRTDAEGRYTLTTFRKGDGAYGGSHRVVVIPWMDGWIDLPDDAQTGRKPPTVLPRPDIPERYRQPSESPLKAEVVAGKNNVINLEMVD